MTTSDITQAEVERIAASLSEAQCEAIMQAETLVDGRVLVPAYSIPDHLTRIHSVQRSRLNRAGLAVRYYLQGERA